MFTVMGDVLKCSTSKTIINDFTGSRGVCGVWTTLCNYYNSSIGTELQLQEMSSWVMSTRLHMSGWDGEQGDFLLNWKDMLRLYIDISPEPYLDYQGVQFLNVCISATANLAQVLTTHRAA